MNRKLIALSALALLFLLCASMVSAQERVQTEVREEQNTPTVPFVDLTVREPESNQEVALSI